MQALGVGTADEPEPEVILGQFVTLVRDGETVRLSKRTGNIVTLADILDEVDPDVARLTFLLQGIDTTQTFDLDIVTSQSMENPVYYVQYAHARVVVDRTQGRRARASCGAPLDSVDLVAARARARARSAALARGVPGGAAARGRDARAAPRHDLGARVRVAVPRLLPRLPRHHRRRRAHPGPALADGGVPDRPGRRARDPRRERTRGDGADRRGRRREATPAPPSEASRR